MNDRRSLFIIIASALIVFVSMGTRQSFGIFLAPISAELNMGRESYSLAIALQNILLGFPLAGLLADRFGSRWIAVFGGALYALAMTTVALLSRPLGLFLSFGLLAGVALSATSYVVVLGAVAPVVPEHRRSSIFGLITAAGSFGMFAVVPFAGWLLTTVGWRMSFSTLAFFTALIVLLALGFPKRSTSASSGHVDAGAATLVQTLQRAGRTTSYWLLLAGFFVCGFHVAFIATHFPAYLSDNGIASRSAALALSMIGLFNIGGSFLFGRLGDRYRKKFLLSLLYFSRAVVIALFLAVPLTGASAIVFGAVIGFLWLATVPLTSGAVVQIFGSRYLSTLYGIVMFSHQIGAFLGVWLGGRMFDATGSYTTVWLAAIVLGVVAAIVHLPISEQRVALHRRPAVAGERV